MVDTIKFSQMTAGGDIANNDKVPGLLSGANVLFNNPWTFLPPGSTADRPAPSSAINYRLRFNTDDQLYEYYDAILGQWTQLQESAFTQGPFVTYTADSSLPDAQNLGALANGILKQTITLGVATLDIAVNGTDYYGPGFTGYFQSPAGVKDINGNIVVGFDTAGITANNYIVLTSSIDPGAPIISSAGVGTNIDLTITGKGSGAVAVQSQTSSIPFYMEPNVISNIFRLNFSIPTLTANRTATWQDTDGIVAYTNGTVLSLQGTPSQVLVNGTSGTPVTGTDIILSTPQDIAPTSNVTFNTLNLTAGTIFDSNGNVIFQMNLNPSAVNYMAVNNSPTGNPVEIGALGTDTNIGMLYRAQLTGQHIFVSQNTSPLIIESGTSAQHSTTFAFANTATSRTVTFPDADGTVAFTSGASGIVNPGLINQIAYYAAAGTTLSGLTIANQGVLTTDGSGLPAWVPLIAGQILVGTTSGAPVAAAINSGTNITVANGSGSITVNLSGIVSPVLGGTGVNNGSNTLTLAGTLATSGAFASVFTMTGATNVTFPTSGTLATTAGTVSSITGTANQVIASAPTGAVTLSLPQSIATSSTPTFGAMTLSGTGSLNALQLTTASNNIVYIKGTTNGTDKASLVFGGDASGSGAAGTYWTVYNYQSGNFGFYNGNAGSQVLNLTSTLATFSGALSAPSITFGGSTLSTYTTASWTPAVSFGGSSTGITYAVQTGTYTTIGNITYFTFNILLSSKGAQTGTAAISLPGPGASGGSQTFCMGVANPLTFVGDYLIGIMTANAFNIYTVTSVTGIAALTNSAFADNTQITGNGFYFS